MQFGIVTGKLVATQKVPELQGIALKVIEPCDEKGSKRGDAIVAVDSIGAREGDLILWVGKREASMASDLPQIKNRLPVDGAITGIVDDIG